MRNLILAAALAASPALGDEVWSTPHGDIIYHDEIGEMAIFQFTVPDEGAAWMFLPGLAGNYYDRSTHWGYWIAETPQQGCASAMQGPNGTSGWTWGRVVITFDTPGFPTSLSVAYGYCFSEPYLNLRGEIQ